MAIRPYTLVMLWTVYYGCQAQNPEIYQYIASLPKSVNFMQEQVRSQPSLANLGDRQTWAEMFQTMKHVNISTECRQDVNTLRKDRDGISNALDSFGKLPSGVSRGALLWLGDYDQCIAISVNESGPGFMHYCRFYLGSKSSPAVSQLPLSLSLCVGTCIPRSCSESMVNSAINEFLALVPQANVSMKMMCQLDQAPWSASTTVITVFLAVLGCVIAAGTLLDVLRGDDAAHSETWKSLVAEQRDSGESSESTPLLVSTGTGTEPAVTALPVRILLCFSVRTNGAKLLKVSRASSELRCVHGIRFLSMTWVILGHSIFFSIQFFKNPLDGVEMIRSFSFQAILNATVSVDSFFMLSGLLLGYLFFFELERQGRLSWPRYYLHRYWRLTPMYMLVIGVYAGLFQQLGSGPVWPSEGIDQNCQHNWWTNLLYINNLVYPLKQCLAWSWFLANDMQFYWISPIFLILLKKNWKLGVIAVLLMLLASYITTGVISSHFDFPADMIGVGGTNSAHSQTSFFKYMYFPPYTRIGPYLVGLLYGYAIYRTRFRMKIPKVLVIVGWCTAAAVNLAVLYGMYGVAHGNYALSPPVRALYNTLSRSAWALGLGWVILACVNGYGGFVNTLLSWEGLVPLSRLTYAAYLIHPMVIMGFNYAARTLYYFNAYAIISLFMSFLTVTYFLAFVVSVAMESPFMALEKALFR